MQPTTRTTQPHGFSFGAGMDGGGGATATLDPAAQKQQGQQSGVQGQDMLSAFLAALGQHIQQQGMVGQQAQQLKTDQTFGRHVGMDGAPMGDYSNSPWSGPLKFQSAGERMDTMKGYGSSVGVPAPTDQASNPYSFGAMGPARPDTQGPDQNHFSPYTLPTPGGFQGIINPNLPQQQKFQDPNMFQVQLPQPGAPLPPLPAGAVAGDGQTNYGRKGSSFSFGAPRR